MISPPHKRMHVSAGDRFIVFGASGTGKTTFVLRLITELRKLYNVPAFILNSKPDSKLTKLEPKLFRRKPTAAHPRLLVRPTLQIWRPLDDDIQEYDKYFRDILRLGAPSILYIDELSSVGGTTKTSYPVHLVRLLKQVRDLRTTVIVGSQEYAGILRQVMQSNHLIVFRMGNDYDRRNLAGELDIPALDIPDRFGYWYRRIDRNEPAVYYRSMQEQFH